MHNFPNLFYCSSSLANTGEAILFSFLPHKKMKYGVPLHKLTQRFLCILRLSNIRKGTRGARNKILDVCIAAEIIIFMYFTTRL
jgi:hypothetical protein